MYTFGPLIAKNSRSGRLLGGAPITVTTLDGVTLSTVPAPLVTNHEGYLPTFTADTDQRVILARPRGGDPLPLYAHEAIGDAAEAADTINTGRLSEASLTSTYAALDDPRLRDTGFRRMPTPNGAAYIRRHGSAIDVYVNGLSHDDTSTPLLVLPAGFRPPFTTYGFLGRTGSRQLVALDVVGSSGAILQATSHTIPLYAWLNFSTAQPFPTQPYPGTPI